MLCLSYQIVNPYGPTEFVVGFYIGKKLLGYDRRIFQRIIMLPIILET